jgi:hypothetical protein
LLFSVVAPFPLRYLLEQRQNSRGGVIMKLSAASALAWALICGSAFGQTAQDTSTATPAPAAQSSVKLRTVIAALPAGTPWLSLRAGNFCISDPYIETWKAGRAPQPVSFYMPAFKTELEKAGYKVVTPGEDNLFDPEAASADYEAAAVITDEHIDGCMSKGGLLAKGNPGDIRGDSSMKIDWQIYSPIKKQVVAHVSTTGAAHLDQSTSGGQQRLLADSFAQNVAALALNADFRAAMTAPRRSPQASRCLARKARYFSAGISKPDPAKSPMRWEAS